MRFIAFALVTFWVLTAGMGKAQQPAPRIALVIGNAAYTTPGWGLANPVNDARLMKARLDSLGFATELVTNADKATMERAFQRFGARLRNGDPRTVSVVFYAGHGAEKDGDNYLVPVDATARTLQELRYQAPPVQLLLSDIANARNAVNILILDACRDMSFPDGPRALGRGGVGDLGEVANVFIAYATAPGRTAPDGAGRNSWFTAALAAALQEKPSEPIEVLFSDLSVEVRRASGNAQSPRYTNGLPVSRWSFAPLQVAATITAPQTIVAHDATALHPRVRAAAEAAREAEVRANLFAQRAREMVPLAEDAARRGRASEAGFTARSYGDPQDHRYEGAWSNGDRRGYGILSLRAGANAGDRYVANWNGASPADGPAVMFYGQTLGNPEKLLRYEGQFTGGYRTGVGVYYWGDGRRYAGVMNRNIQQGPGVHRFASGARYEGEWAGGQYNGYGVEWDSRGRLSRAGFWKDNQLTAPMAR